MPTAWEEVWDTGIATNANFQKGVSGSTHLSWKSPKVVGTTFQIAYAPANDGDQTNKKSVSGIDSNFGSGYSVVLDTGTEDGGINFFIGGSRTELDNKVQPSLRDLSGDHEEAVIGLQFKFGPVALGGQVSGERLRTRALNTAEYYGNSSWGIAFNVNDSLSVSYSEARHLMTKTHKSNASGGDANTNEYTPKSWMRGDSIQVAYTMGGVGLKFARTNYDNTAFSFDKKIPRQSQIVAVSLAF
jgi:predicted porin